MKHQLKQAGASILLTLAMLCVLCGGVWAMAESGKSLTVGMTAAKSTYVAGETVVLKVNASAFSGIDTGIYGFSAKLQYDADKFTFVADSPKLLQDAQQGYLGANVTDTGVLSLLYYNDAAEGTMGCMAAGELIELSFKVKTAVDSDCTFTLTGANFVDKVETDRVAVTASPLTVTLSDATVTGIVLAAAPAKTTYLQGEELDLTGASITVSYSEGADQPLAVAKDMVSGYNANTLGEQTVTITHQGKTATFTVTVVSRQAVDQLIADIAALDLDSLTPADKAAVDALMKRYEALSALEKAAVTNLADLQKAAEKTAGTPTGAATQPTAGPSATTPAGGSVTTAPITGGGSPATGMGALLTIVLAVAMTSFVVVIAVQKKARRS